jgi:hypothetical protein
MPTPICGVLLLDPSLLSPLKLVKVLDEVPAQRGPHPINDQREPRQLTLLVIRHLQRTPASANRVHGRQRPPK